MGFAKAGNQAANLPDETVFQVSHLRAHRDLRAMPSSLPVMVKPSWPRSYNELEIGHCAGLITIEARREATENSLAVDQAFNAGLISWAGSDASNHGRGP